MTRLRALGCYLPSRVVDNTEVARALAADPAWIAQSTGIHQRRFAARHETVASLGIQAAAQCLRSVEMSAAEIGLLLVSSGSAEHRFPGPATAIAAGLEMGMTPAIDLPLPSAGAIFGLALAASLCHSFGQVLVVAAEIMSRVMSFDHANLDTAVLFGDGAGACLVSQEAGFGEIADSLLVSDGTFAEALTLSHDTTLQMDGVAESKFVYNLDRYGNTSSASMLIAAAEWWGSQHRVDEPVIFAAFGAGLNWGAVLVRPI